MRTELPKKWACRITSENKDILVDWAEGRQSFDSHFSRANGAAFQEGHFVICPCDDDSFQLWNERLDGFNYTEITTEEFKRLVLKEELTELPRDGWYISGSKEFRDFIGEDELIYGDYPNWGYFIRLNGEWGGDLIYDIDNKTEISLSDYKRLTNKTKQMEKEIIGYKSPMNLFYDDIKKGTIYKKQGEDDNGYYPTGLGCGSNIYYLPDEIVETWEPVYKQKEPQITINGYKGEFFEEYVKFGCAKISKYVFIQLSSINKDFVENNREIESVTIGKGTFSKEQIKQIAEYYKNK